MRIMALDLLIPDFLCFLSSRENPEHLPTFRLFYPADFLPSAECRSFFIDSFGYLELCFHSLVNVDQRPCNYNKVISFP